MLHHYGGRAPLTTEALISHHQRSRNGQMRARETRSRCVFRPRATDVPAGTRSDILDFAGHAARFCQESGFVRYVSCVGGFRYPRRASSIRTT